MNLIEKIRSNKKTQIITLVILFLLLIIMLIFSLVDTKSKNTASGDSVLEYVSDLENKLSEKLSMVEGAGKVSVVIKIDSGFETVLATEKTTTTENGKTTVVEKPVYVNGKTVTTKELYPKISGVLIVLNGTKSLTVQNRIQQATMSLLSINLSQIEILTGK